MWSWRSIRNWLRNIFNQVTANLIATGILALLAILFAVVVAYVRVIGPYLRTPLPTPAWLLLSVALVLVLALIIHRHQLTRRPVATSTPPPSPDPTRTAKPPDFYPFSHFDLDWEIMPHFLSAFRTVENPSRGSLDEFIKGPFCSQCHRLLRRAIEGTWLSACVLVLLPPDLRAPIVPGLDLRAGLGPLALCPPLCPSAPRNHPKLPDPSQREKEKPAGKLRTYQRGSYCGSD